MDDLFLGIDLGGSHISAWLLDRKGNTHNPFGKISINSNLSSDKLVDYLLDLINIRRNPTRNNNILAIGLASPGPLDPYKGVIISPPNLPKIKNLEIVKILREKTALSVFLVNDADAAVLSEHWLGAAKGFKNVIMLTLGTGVGSGVILNSRLQRGRGMAAEWGHTSIYSSETRTCACGRRNCLEIFCSTEGLARTYCQKFGVRRTDLSSEFVQGISVTMRKLMDLKSEWADVFETYCYDLAQGILNIVNVHHPDCIVLGGGIANLSMAEAVKEILEEEESYKLRPLLEGLEIKVSVNSQSGILGAAKYAMDSYDSETEKNRMDHGIVS